MHTITARLTDENGMKRAAKFWVQDQDVESERIRFESAGYTVKFHELHWIVATRIDANREQSAVVKWVKHEELDALCEELHMANHDILIFSQPGKLQRHILAPPRQKGEN